MRRIGAWVAGAVFALAAVLHAQALDFPTLTGRVVDGASILDTAARTTLTQKLAALESRTTDQLVIVTLPSLQGTSIEDFGYQLGRTWKIGQSGKNNGVLLIVAPSDRKVRIEVGYGLEGTLTDAITKLIIENAIIPRFRAGDFPGGIARGTDDIIQVLTGDAEEYKARATKPPARHPSFFAEALWWVTSNFGFIIAIFIILGAMDALHSLLIALGLAEQKPKSGFWHWWTRASSGAGSGSSSGGSSWSSSGSSSSGGGFSGGGGSFGGGGSSGSW